MENFITILGVIIMSISVLLRNKKYAHIMYAKHFEFAKKVYGIDDYDIYTMAVFHSRWLYITSIILISLGIINSINLPNNQLLTTLNSYVPILVALSYLCLYLYTSFSHKFRKKD
jgi:hypothetical protein